MTDRTDEKPECSEHPDAPHGFNRNMSHSLGRYVCECEGWVPPEPEEEGKPWVELTDDDIWDVMCKVDSFMYRTFARALEQKIKEKNS